MAIPQVLQAAPELALIEAFAPVPGDGAQRAGDPRQPDRLANFQRAARTQFAGAIDAVDEVAGQRQHDGRGEAVGGQLNGRGQHLGQRQPAVAFVQGEPAVDGAGHLHAADVPAHRHCPVSVAPQAVGVATCAGPADGEERLGRAAGRGDHCQHVAAQSAQVRAHDRHGGSGADGSIGGRAAPLQ